MVKQAIASIVLQLSLSALSGAQVTGNAPVTVSLTGGGLQMTLSGGGIVMAPHTLSGVDAISSSSSVNNLGLDIRDMTGSGAGWNVSVQSSNFVSGANVIPVADVGPNTGFRWNTPSSATLTALSGTTSGILLNPSAINLASPHVILSAPVGAGIGRYQYRLAAAPAPFRLLIPFNGRPGNYSATVTFTIGSGPAGF